MSTCCCRRIELAEEGREAGLDKETREWLRLVFAGLVAGQSMIFGLAASMSPPEGVARWVIHGSLAFGAIAVFLLVGLPILKEAIEGIRRGRVVIEQLFLTGIGGAFFASLHCTVTGVGHIYYEVVAILVTIYTFGKIVGERKRRAAVAEAVRIGKEFARCRKVLPSGEEILTNVSEIIPGEVVRVGRGEVISVDGVIEQGVAFVRESAISGELYPVVKREGDRVVAGSVCLDDGLVIRATSKGTERVLDRLMEEVRIAQSKAARLQREADRIVGWFLPMVVGIAVVTFVVWTWAVGWERGLFNALAVLVVACPCSMGLATPVGIWAALSSLARRGLIARDSDLVEMLGKVDVVVFDKTGTLGEERLDLVDFVVKEGAVRSQVLEEVAAIESKSSHPIALSFRRAHEAEAQRTWLLPGVGIAGVVGRVVLEVGNRGLLDGNMQTVADELRGKLRVGVRGTHEVWVKRDGELVGLGVLRERLREGAFLTIEAFEGMGIECVVMTGDRREFAEQHGFRVIHSELLPEEKAALVREYQKKGKKVLYIGDGINDGPAMATADVAVAVGENASILARETAQGILPSGDLLVLPAAVKTCVRTVRAIRGNLLYAAAYNIVGIALAAAGVIHPVVAALLMLLSSFGVSWRALAPAREEEDVKLQNLSNVDNSIRKSFLRFGFGLEKVRDLPALLRSGERMAVQLNGFELGLVVGGLVMQGVLLPWMGGFSVVSGGMLAIFFGVVAVMCLVFGRKREWGADAAMVGMMFSFGGLMMLLGWLADAGFLPVVRNGVCLCGCRDSGLGWGLLKPSWMMVGMAVSILPAVRFEPTGFVVGRLVCGVVSLLGMIVGMVTSAWLMAQIPVAPLHASAHFFATFSAMNLGMTFGMLLACRFLRMAFVKWRDVREETKR